MIISELKSELNTSLNFIRDQLLNLNITLNEICQIMVYITKVYIVCNQQNIEVKSELDRSPCNIDFDLVVNYLNNDVFKRYNKLLQYINDFQIDHYVFYDKEKSIVQTYTDTAIIKFRDKFSKITKPIQKSLDLYMDNIDIEEESIFTTCDAIKSVNDIATNLHQAYFNPYCYIKTNNQTPEESLKKIKDSLIIKKQNEFQLLINRFVMKQIDLWNRIELIKSEFIKAWKIIICLLKHTYIGVNPFIHRYSKLQRLYNNLIDNLCSEIALRANMQYQFNIDLLNTSILNHRVITEIPPLFGRLNGIQDHDTFFSGYMTYEKLPIVKANLPLNSLIIDEYSIIINVINNSEIFLQTNNKRYNFKFRNSNPKLHNTINEFFDITLTCESLWFLTSQLYNKLNNKISNKSIDIIYKYIDELDIIQFINFTLGRSAINFKSIYQMGEFIIYMVFASKFKLGTQLFDDYDILNACRCISIYIIDKLLGYSTTDNMNNNSMVDVVNELKICLESAISLGATNINSDYDLIWCLTANITPFIDREKERLTQMVSQNSDLFNQMKDDYSIICDF